jgi:hypothetical protein
MVMRRGRWQSRRSTVDIYIDTNLPYPDAKVASALSGPDGPCQYKLCSSMINITDDELATFAPRSKEVLPSLALLMAKALIWASFEDLSFMPTSMKEKWKLRFQPYLTSFVVGDNPVNRIPLFVSGEGDRMCLTELPVDDSGVTNLPSTEWNTSFAAYELNIRRKMEEIANRHAAELQRGLANMSRELAMVKANVARIAVQPMARSIAPNEAEDDARISEGAMRLKYLGTPKNLFDLWKEYEFGLNGKKPAKSLTSAERGQCASSYSRRKIFWDLIEKMIRKGHTSLVSIDRVYRVYGRCNSVNTILLQLRADRRRGGHPELR